MYLEPIKYTNWFMKKALLVLSSRVKILEDIGIFVFSVTRASRVRIGDHERCCKANSESFPVIMNKSDYVKNNCG